MGLLLRPDYEDIAHAVFESPLYDCELLKFGIAGVNYYGAVESGAELTVIGPENDGSDTLTEVEHLFFNNTSSAIDVFDNAALGFAQVMYVILGVEYTPIT